MSSGMKPGEYEAWKAQQKAKEKTEQESED